MKIIYLFILSLLSTSFIAQTIKVNGRASYTDTKIDLVKGQTISLTASGTVYANATVASGPEGIINRPDWETYCVIKGKPHEGLIAKIGNGTAFFIGKSASFTVQENGRLFLGVNDNDLGNNKGEFIVVVVISNNEIKVGGKKTWTATGMKVKNGQQLKINARGTVYANATVSTGPEGITNRPDWDIYCIVKGKPHEGLIAKIGNGVPFFVGSSMDFIANESGELFLGVNDKDVGNNKGEFYVIVGLK